MAKQQQTPPDAPKVDPLVTVQATRMVFYGNVRRRAGDVFQVRESELTATNTKKEPTHFARSVKRVQGARERTTTNQEALSQECVNIRDGRAPATVPDDDDNPLHAD